MAEDKKCLLVIDDDEDVCQIIKTKFELLGYTVLTALDGAEGFRKTEESKPGCVLLDLRIPKGEDGLAYLRKLREYRHSDLQEQTRMRQTPVVVLSGMEATVRLLFKLEGISGFITKPFDLTDLQAKIEHFLR